MGSKNGKPVLREEDITQLAQTSGLDRKQVEDHFNGFKAEHPNGKMNKKEFTTMLSKALPKKDASKMDKHVFRVYDTNLDGFIDFVEFMVVYYVMADGSPEEVLLKIFRIFDINSDGVISKKELTRLVKDMYAMIKSESPETVRIIEIVETFETASKEMIAKSAFAEMDKDTDGKITTEEFISACLGQEELSRILALKCVDIFVQDD
eukprot:GFUD01030878.1.p1 GENE.GFUD01030878.1~~GFUD01030878.1.p1  ORF type:complete len:207 (+),score=75.03 GFUD01030878.1:465-1085(+)